MVSNRRTPERGDIYWIDPNPVSGREIKNRHRYVVITSKVMNRLGTAMTVPVTTGGQSARDFGYTVVITGHDTTGVAICNQVRSFDIESRIKEGSAKFIENLDEITLNDIVNKVLSIIEAT